MATQKEHTDKLKLDGGTDEERERVFAMNLGGESSVAGAPVVISTGLHVHDSVLHEAMLMENPPIAHVPAQDPTPLEDYKDGKVPIGTGRELPGQGGAAQVRRVHDRTPPSAYEAAQRPYNRDPSVAQRAGLTGQDAAEETAEGKHSEGGALEAVREAGREQREQREEELEEAEKRAEKGTQRRQNEKKG